MDVRYAGDRNDRSDAGLLYLHLVQAVKLIELADLYLYLFIRLMVVADDDLLIYLYLPVVHLADADTAHIFVVVDGADKDLRACVGVALGGGDIAYNGFKQGFHVGARLTGIQRGGACLCGGKYKGAVQLRVVGIQLQEKLQDLVHNLVRSCFGTVDLVDADDDGKLQLQCLSEDKLGLRHGAFKSVHHQDDAVYHLQDTLHLAAEVRVAGGVDNVDFCVFIHDGGIF